MKATLVLKNGLIYTVDKERSWAQAIAIVDKKIVFVGTDQNVETYIDSETTVIDLDGKMVLPAFVDSHMHPIQAAHIYKFQLPIFDVTGENQVQIYLSSIREFAEKNPDFPWIIGAGYSRSAFDEVGPRKEWLDEISTDRPIAMTSKDGHSMWVNSKALEMAHITKDTPQPEEGVIKKDPKTGEPSGLLQEPGAMKLVSSLFPEPPIEQARESLIWLQEWLNAKGITTVHEAMLGLNERNFIKAYDELAQEGKMTVRYRASWSMSPDADVLEQIEEGNKLAEKFTHPHFKAHSFKFFADHVIEEETGFLLEPYTHRNDNWYGIKVWDDDVLREAFTKIDSLGYQIHVHVIGDGAARYTLDALDKAEEINGKRDSRHSFAHLQLAQPDDIERIGKLGLSVHTSPYWMTMDDYFWKLNLPYLGRERAFHQQYPFKSLFKANANVTIASDFWVSEPEPLLAVYFGMTRHIPQALYDEYFGSDSPHRRVSDLDVELEDGEFGVLPPFEERATLEEMIVALTFNGAYANFLEDELGSIEVGKLADLVVLEQNLFDIDIEQIPATEIVMTFFEGQQVHPQKP